MAFSPPNISQSVSAKLVSREQLWAGLELFASDPHHKTTLHWPITHLPPEVEIGDELALTAHSKKEAQEESYDRMRRLLEELIN